MGTLLQVALGTVYAWSFFQKPVMNACHWSNAQAAGAFSLAIFSLGLAAAWGGINLPRFGPRRLAMSGGFLFGAGYLIGAYALSCHSLPLFYLGYGVVGGIGLGLGYVTPIATSAKWFPDRKGAITGMVVMGFGLGALVMSKLLAPALMAWAGGNLVTVFMVLGLIMVAVTLPSGYFLVNPPAGHLPAGYVAPAEAKGRDGASNMTPREGILSWRFLLMWVVFFLNINVGIMFISFQSPLLQDLLKRTLDPALLSQPLTVASLAASGATLIAVSSLFNGIGRFFWGGMSDRIGRTLTFRLILGSQVPVFLALLVVTNPVIFSVLVCYVLLCYGGGFGTMPSYVLEVFGARLMPVVYGVILTAWGFAGVTGPQIVALLKDHAPKDAAHLAFAIAAGMLVAGLALTVFLSDRKFAQA
jgi:OFA family oxalate/formate antiporter-like MFS transporter